MSLFFDPLASQEIIHAVMKDGFYIARGVIPNHLYERARQECLSYFKATDSSHLGPPLRGHIAPGIANVIGYANSKRWHVIRACLFPWNSSDPSLESTVFLSRLTSKYRNQLLGLPVHHGLHIEDDLSVAYTSVSCYPPNGGFLHSHRDSHGTDELILHCKVELTHLGTDYHSGGLVIFNSNGERINLSKISSPRDLIFFSGNFCHEVLPTYGGKYGRVAVFEIPTKLNTTFRSLPFTSEGTLINVLLIRLSDAVFSILTKAFMYFLRMLR